MNASTHTLARARTSRAGWLLGGVLLLALLLAPPARAIDVDSLSVSSANSSAGERANLTIDADIDGGRVDDMTYDLPAGIMADLQNAEICQDTGAQFQNLVNNSNACPAASRIGIISSEAKASIDDLPWPVDRLTTMSAVATGSVYRLPAVESDEVMRIGIVLRPATKTIKISGFKVKIDSENMLLRGDIVLRSAAGGAADQGGLRARVFNVPDKVDAEASLSGYFSLFDFEATLEIEQVTMTMLGTLSNGKRFLSNPTSCSARPMSLTVKPKSGSTDTRSATLAARTDCGTLVHTPTTSIAAATPNMDTGTAMTVGVSYDDPLNRTANGGNGGRVKAHTQRVEVVLPAGVEFNPAGAGAITQCTDGQFNVTSSSADSCPKTSPTSVIGTASITSPVIGTLSGNVYFGQPDGTSPLVRLFVVVEQNGIRIKIIGNVAVNATTGQITTSFDDLPQTPFTNFEMTFNGGNTAMLRTPRSCSTTAHQMAATITPYGGSAATPSTPLAVTGDCHSASRFAPTFTPTLSDTAAGAEAEFTIRMLRPQGDARFTSVDVSLPPGLVGKVGSVTPCSTANANAGTCPASSKIGTVQSKAGDSELSQVTLNGELFLTDAPSGAIAGLSMKVPAVVGPVNLGNVIVPMKIVLRPSDYGLDIVADSIPTRIDGIPLLLREIEMVIDRTANNPAEPFMINSTSCTARRINATLESDQSTSSASANTYEPSGCDTLAFSPSLTLNPSATLAPAVDAAPDAASAMTLGLTVPSQSSAVRNVSLEFPDGAELNPFSATALEYCSAGAFAVSSLAPDTCPTASRLATVAITTPSVGTLTGYAYFGAPASDKQILRLFIMAEAGPGTDAIRMKFAGDLDISPGGRMTARLQDLPAIQFTQMTMSFPGGATAAFRTPRTCGTATLGSAIVGHVGGAIRAPSATYDVSGGDCDATRFAPTSSTSVSSPTAIASTTLTTSISRADGDARIAKVRVVLPPGLLGNLTSADQCPLATAAAGACGASSEVGTVSTQTGDSGSTIDLAGKAYLTAPPAGGIAGLALVVDATVGDVDLGNTVVQLKIELRPEDNGLTIEGDVPTHLKGVPLLLRQITMEVNKSGFIRNRSECDATSITTLLTSDQGTTSSATTPYQATDCTSLDFSPTIDIAASPPTADTASAMTLAVNLPPSGQAQVKDVTVNLPAGVEVNPGAGHGLEGCTLDQFGPGSSAEVECPKTSKIGTATVTSPLIGTLTGSVYFGNPGPGSLMRMLVVAQQGSSDALRIKIVGDVSVDADTGRITTTFSDLPQTPFSQFKLDLQGGQRAVLSTPRTCGTFRADGSVQPYGGGTGVAPTADLSLAGGCTDPFTPSVSLQTTTTQAGADTGLTTVISRPDGDARLGRVAVSMPDGLLGRLDSVPKCDVAAARAAACPASSRVGSATTVSGSGASTLPLPGDVYLTNGFDGAIAGLAVIVRAQAGPIDLGTAIVLMRINVRGNAQGIDITSDQLPTRLQGVPLTLQSIALNIDRAGFMFNASSCGTKGASAAFTSDIGTTASASASLPTTGCGTIPFGPKMDVDLTGSLKKDSKPGVTAKLTLPSGHANVSRVALTLPSGIGADIAALGNMCSRADYDADACPAGAVVGTATAKSPVLDAPLGGPVTLIKKEGSALPDLGVRLRGPVNVELYGAVTIGAGNRLVTTFDGIPDVPLSLFELGLSGGKTGALVVSGDLCTAPEIETGLRSHSGASTSENAIPRSSRCSTRARSARPSATVRFVNITSSRPSLRVSARRGSVALKSVRVTLPKGMTVHRRSASRKTRLKALNTKGRKLKLTRRSVGWTSRTFRLRLPKSGARTVTMTLRRGALRSAKRIRRSKKIRVVVRLTPVRGPSRTQRITVRVGRKR